MTAKLVCSQSGVNLYELLASDDNERLESMLALYAQSFPDYAHYLPRMRRRAAFSGNTRTGHLAHYWLLEHEGKPIGLTTFRYIQKRECGLGISFAVDKKARSIKVGKQRLSAFIIGQIMQQLKKDAAQTKTKLYGLVTEVEHRSLMEHYKKMGMLELPVQYFEPIYPPEQDGDDLQSRVEKINFIPVFLAITPNGSVDIKPCLLRKFIKAFLVDHYDLPQSHPMVQKTLNSIEQREERIAIPDSVESF